VPVGEAGERHVSHLPVVQPEAQPETHVEGEPGTLAEGLGAGLDLGLDKTLAKGLDRGLVESLDQTLAKTLVESEAEGELEALASRILRDLGAAESVSLRVGKPAGIPSPGRPPGVGCTAVTSIFPVSANISCNAIRERNQSMVVKTARKGLNRETRALLEYIRRMAPVNTACGLPEQVAISRAHLAADGQ
jgi:hypothetical protein